MAITLGKLLSLLIALGYAAFGAANGGSVGTGLTIFAYALFPLSLIWLPEHWGSVGERGKKTILNYEEDNGRRGGPWRTSPPGLVALMGWFFLVGLPLVGYLLAR